MHFFKYSSIGNDFILINNIEEKIPENKFSDLAKRLCRRRFNIGADGILILEKSQKADFKMRIFNSDGSEAEMCGNGIRAIAKHVYDSRLTKSTEIRVETLADIKILKLFLKDNLVESIEVDMGTPKLLRNEIPMTGVNKKVIGEEFRVDDEIYKITCVSMGNPHCIIYDDDVNSIDIKIGKKIETHQLFPNKTNVEFVQVLNNNELLVKVWERGAGETLACGTGACATVVSSVLNNYVKKDQLITVHLPGGDLKIKWADDDHVYMTGPSEKAFEGDVDLKG
ncbi:MAG: diaminopimelate epimerase [Candidatus Helarchaeota archaeon]|nr:diaminopimelate epimerase [Candidatus Helarchaeota archaeon]